MELTRTIPTEVVQLLTAAEAAEYRLVPSQRQGNEVRCYGVDGHDYHRAAEELEVLYGWQVAIEPLAEPELQRLLAQYYRPDTAVKTPSANRLTDIATGQGFLMALVGEAFRDYASDIHIEPYEERCRIRLRIDGRLAERYVVERTQYAPLVNQIKILANLDISEKRLPQDGRILYDRGGNKFDVRVSSLPTIYGEKIVLRLLTRHVELLELKNLGFSDRQYDDYCRAIARPFGMVLICGPTGSGNPDIIIPGNPNPDPETPPVVAPTPADTLYTGNTFLYDHDGNMVYNAHQGLNLSYNSLNLLKKSDARRDNVGKFPVFDSRRLLIVSLRSVCGNIVYWTLNLCFN